MERLTHFFFLLRPSHWSKAAFVMLGFFYTPLSGYVGSALLAALAFCFISSAVYIYNDIQALQAMEGRRPRPVVPGSLRAGCFAAGKI